MSNVENIKGDGIDVASIKAAAQAEINAERTKKFTVALKKKMVDLANAEQIVSNIKREIADLEESIKDGSFAG